MLKQTYTAANLRNSGREAFQYGHLTCAFLTLSKLQLFQLNQLFASTDNSLQEILCHCVLL